MPIAALLLIAIALVGWALFAPLAALPVVGSIRFDQSIVGSPAIAWSIIALLVVSAALIVPKRCCRWTTGLGIAIGGLVLGYVAGALRALYAGKIEQALTLMEGGGDSGIQQVIDGMKLQPAAYLLTLGYGLWLAAAIWASRKAAQGGD